MLVECSLLVKTATLVMADRVPPRVNVALVPGRSFGDMEPILSYVADVYHRGKVRDIILPGADGEQFGRNVKYVANAGRIQWSYGLDQLGVDINKAVFFSGPGYHTRAETNEQLELLFKYSEVMPWAHQAMISGVMLIAHPQQLSRAMLGIVDQLNETERRLRIYADHPLTTDWTAAVKGPQGAELKPRRDNIKDEFSRIPRYQKNGDLASYEDLLDYYRWRDGNLIRIYLGIIRMFANNQSRRDWSLICREIRHLQVG